MLTKHYEQRDISLGVEQPIPEKSSLEAGPLSKIKPFMTITVEWKKPLGTELFQTLKAHFKDTLMDIDEAVVQVFGASKDTIGRGVEIAIKGGYGADVQTKSIFVFFKGARSESDIHVQSFETPDSLLKNKEWLAHHLKKAKVEYETTFESLTPNRTAFCPRGILSFFTRDILSFLSSSIILFIIAGVDLFQNNRLTPTGSASLLSGIVAFSLWILSSSLVYLRKRKTYVLELGGSIRL
jgi:hypothetical protein